MNKDYIKSQLEKFPFVLWDRFCKDGGDLTFFGWIEREDSYKDFMVLYFVRNRINSYMTSSKKYSLKIFKIMNKGNGRGHHNCKRVEDFFYIENMVVIHS